MNKIQSILSLIRFGNIIIAGITILLASYMIASTTNILSCMFIVGFSMALGNIFNDLLDINIDKIIHNNRPLITQTITKKEAKILITICFIFILIFFGNLNDVARYVYIIILLPLLILYSLFLKKIPFIGNIVVAFLLGFVFIFTELVALGTYNQLIIPAFLAFGLSWIRELIKDISDYDGDYNSHINTVPVYFSITFSKYFTIFLIVFFSIAALMPYFIHYYRFNYLLSLIFLVEIPLYILVFLLLNKPTKTTYAKLTYLTKGIVINGLIVLYITTI